MGIEELKVNRKNLPRNKSEPAYSDELSDNINYDKMKVECICPKCGDKHIMNFHWIGRGTPRKFCQSCKSSRE